MSTVFNYAKGRAAALMEANPNSAVLVLLEAAEADAALRDYADLAALLAAAGNTELSSVGYARKTGLTATVTTDNAADKTTISVPSQVFTGVATGGTINKAILGVSTGAGDANIVPIAALDAFVLTDGNDITINFSSGHFYEAT